MLYVIFTLLCIYPYTYSWFSCDVTKTQTPKSQEKKLWARTPLQIGDSPSAVVLYLWVNFHTFEMC